MGTIRTAFYDADNRRPYKMNADAIKEVTPPGGDWKCVAFDGSIRRSVTWGRIVVANLNPNGGIDSTTEGQIAMAIRALPLMDAALRSIIVLAGNPANLPIIAELAESVIAYVEMPAPRIKESDEDGDEKGDDE